MELKWIVIGSVTVLSFMFVGIAVTEYQKAQCKIGYSWTGRSADDILKICGK